MDSITARPIREEDYFFINQWWKDRKFNPPSRELLPENGLHGIMMCKDDVPVACAYLYYTNSKMGYCDYLVCNPNYKGGDVDEIITRLMISAVETAKKLGVLDFWFITNNKNMIKRCKALDVHVSEEPYYLVMPLRFNNIKPTGF